MHAQLLKAKRAKEVSTPGEEAPAARRGEEEAAEDQLFGTEL